MSRLACLFGLSLATSLAGAQAIHFASETAEAGSTISVVGDNLDASTTYRFDGSAPGSASAVAHAIPNGFNASHVAIVPIPASLPRGVYRLVASSGGKSGNPVYINRPRVQWLDVDSAMVGQEVRAVGRNLSVPGRACVVTLVSPSGRNRVVATVERAAGPSIRFRVPVDTAPGTYKVQVDNGLGGLAATAIIAPPLEVLPARPDPLGLGVAWGADVDGTRYNAKDDPRLPAHAVGDGVTEDGDAIAQDLNWVAAQPKGGILYLPPGDYRVDRAVDASGNGDWLQVHSGAILRGAGMANTRLLVGYAARLATPSLPGTPDYHCPLTIWQDGPAPHGLADLTVQNLNALDADHPSRLLNSYGGTTLAKAVLARVAFRLGNGRGVELTGVRQMVVLGCVFHTTSMASNALNLENSQEVRYVGNREYHRAGRLRVLHSDRITIADSRVEYDNAYRVKGLETSSMDLSFDSRVLVSNCDLGALGPQPPSIGGGDGEVILSQIAGQSDLYLVGAATGGSARTLKSADSLPAVWEDGGEPSPVPHRTVAYIIGGTGMGQSRRVIDHDGSSFTVDAPWETVPDSTSRYALGTPVTDRFTIEGNRIYNGIYGIELEHGAIDSCISGNVLTDTGYIGAFSYAFDGQGIAGSNVTFAPSWGTQILGNVTRNVTGFVPATITLFAEDLLAFDGGPLVLGVDVRGNVVVGNGVLSPRQAEVGNNDGLEIFANNFNRPTTTAQGNELIQGTILQDNTIANSVQPFRIHAVDNGLLTNPRRNTKG